MLLSFEFRKMFRSKSVARTLERTRNLRNVRRPIDRSQVRALPVVIPIVDSDLQLETVFWSRVKRVTFRIAVPESKINRRKWEKKQKNLLINFRSDEKNSQHFESEIQQIMDSVNFLLCGLKLFWGRGKGGRRGLEASNRSSWRHAYPTPFTPCSAFHLGSWNFSKVRPILTLGWGKENRRIIVFFLLSRHTVDVPGFSFSSRTNTGRPWSSFLNFKKPLACFSLCTVLCVNS